jgi:hypothetical protein
MARRLIKNDFLAVARVIADQPVITEPQPLMFEKPLMSSPPPIESSQGVLAYRQASVPRDNSCLVGSRTREGRLRRHRRVGIPIPQPKIPD